MGLVTCRLNRASRCGSCIPPSNSYRMAYLKPPWFTVKVFNRIAMATGISNTETLTVTKRGSKEQQQIPVVTVSLDGPPRRVSTRREEGGGGRGRVLPTIARPGRPPGVRAHRDGRTGRRIRPGRASRDGARF